MRGFKRRIFSLPEVVFNQAFAYLLGEITHRVTWQK